MNSIWCDVHQLLSCGTGSVQRTQRRSSALKFSIDIVRLLLLCYVTKKIEKERGERERETAKKSSWSIQQFALLFSVTLSAMRAHHHQPATGYILRPFSLKSLFFLNYYQLVVIIRRSHPLASFLTFNGYVFMIGINFIHIKHWRCQHWKLNEPRKINLKLKCIHDPYSILRVRWGRHEQCRFKSGRLINEVETATSTSNKSTNCRMRIRSQRTPLQNPTSMPYENNPDSAPIGFDGISPPIRPLRSLDHAAELISIISCYFQ